MMNPPPAPIESGGAEKLPEGVKQQWHSYLSMMKSLKMLQLAATAAATHEKALKPSAGKYPQSELLASGLPPWYDGA